MTQHLRSGHHIGDHDTVHNGPAPPALLEQPARELDDQETTTEVRRQAALAQPDPHRLRALVAGVRDGAGASVAVVALAGQILRLIGG